MRSLAAVVLLIATLAGCGGSKPKPTVPTYAYLTGVHVEGTKVRFDFKSPPREVTERYEPASSVAECGSGRRIRLRGRAFVVVHFRPASTAEMHGEQVVMTYKGPKRLSGPGPVLEIAKSCDFEADLAWAIGLERRLPVSVSKHGSTVTVSFG